MEIKSSEFFKNIKTLPPPDSPEFKQLIQWEIEKCTGGITVNGVYISGWLYWHINHWYIRVDEEDNFGNIIRVKKLPDLRDNEWERAEHLEKCRVQKKGYIEVGQRQGGKSEYLASFSGQNTILFENTQNVIIASNSNDLDLLKDKIDFGLKNLWEGIAIPRLDKTWRGSQIRLGYKEPNGEDRIWSHLIIRNTDDGKNTEVSAGTTAKSFVMDEIGKADFAKAYTAAKPAFMSKHGMRAIPMLLGTGGAFDKGQDAERFFYHPEANDFLGIEDPTTGKKTGLFMSGLYRQDCKYKTTLGKWLKEEKGIEVSDSSELDQIEIWVSDKEKALKKILKEREIKKTDPDQTEYLKLIMYNPLTPEECFMRNTASIFNIRAAKAQQQQIYNNNITGSTIFLEHDGDKIVPVFTDKKPISKFPHTSACDLDAPIVIWEMPLPNPPYGLYIAAADPYRHAKSQQSKSLGAVYVFKRIHDIQSERGQYKFVASYVARPDDREKWNEQARLLIKFYNARTLVENDEMSFIEYMKYKGDAAKYLEPQPAWLQEIMPNTQVRREYGIHSHGKIIDYRDGCVKKYLEEVIHAEKDEEGSIIKEIKGVSQILDPMLLEEIIKHDPDDKDWNGDRLVAAGLALALSYHLDPIIKPAGSSDGRNKTYLSKGHRSLFTEKTHKKAKSRIKRLF